MEVGDVGEATSGLPFPSSLLLFNARLLRASASALADASFTALAANVVLATRTCFWKESNTQKMLHLLNCLNYVIQIVLMTTRSEKNDWIHSTSSFVDHDY